MSSVASPPQSPTSPRSPTSGSLHKANVEPSSSPLPLLNTSQTSRKNLQRPPSYAWNRMSAYSAHSRISEKGSRPISQAFPIFHSSLPYALVRDFAYPVAHPSHYGPPPAASEPPSEASTPISDRQFNESTNGAWDDSGAWVGEASFSTQQLPQLAYGDGPPYSEDEDLHSPVVKSSRHKKSKTSSREEPFDGPGDVHEYAGGRRKYLAGVNDDGTKVYYVAGEGHTASEGGASRQSGYDYARRQSRQNHRRGYDVGEVEDSEEESLGVPDHDDSRYSRDYQFTIASPDEEMHGKAVALFDFERENENELPLTEGQIIWVSYRNGQGWLVAEDPKTGDAGLVPEEYVRLLREIQGGLGSLDAEEEDPDRGGDESGEESGEQSPAKLEHTRSNSNGQGEKNAAVVSSFSTSSKDLDPYPHHLLGEKAGHPPPQIVHIASQTNTPTLRSPSTSAQSSGDPLGRRQAGQDNTNPADNTASTTSR